MEGLFEALVGRQARFVFRVAYALVRNRSDAEDIVQETFLKLYRTGAWRSMNDEKAFLARVAWRIAVTRRKNATDQQINEALPSGGPDPEQIVMTEDQAALVRRLVDALPEELRQPVALSTVEDLNSRQIAQIMGIPEGTVRTRVMRARQILKEKLGGLMEARYGN